MTNRNDSRAQWKDIPSLSAVYLGQLAKTSELEGYWEPTNPNKDAWRQSIEYLYSAIAATALADGEFSRTEYELVPFREEMSFDEVKAMFGVFRDTQDRLGDHVPEFFRGIVEWDSKTHQRNSFDAILAVYATCVAIMIADGRTSTKETAASVELFLKALSRAVIDAGIASPQELDDLLQPNVLAAFCNKLEAFRDGSQQMIGPSRVQPDLASPPPARNRELSILLEDLDTLVGLEAVKRDIKSLVNLVRVQEIRRANGLPNSPMSLHLVFAGNPGTGKTTVARLVAEIYQAIGVLDKGQLVETDRAGMVAGYVGQTALKVQEVVGNAVGGVLFIDEAYSLADGTFTQDFGHEAIDALVKQMEDRRDELVVIVAGYPDKMARFLGSNPGLQSRFNKYIYFDDYTPDEMLQILKLMCSKGKYTLTPEAEKSAHAIFAAAYAVRDKTFGNGRFVRNIFEQTLSRQANRVVNDTTPTAPELSQILPEDIAGEPLESKTNGPSESRRSQPNGTKNPSTLKSQVLLGIAEQQKRWASENRVQMEEGRPDYAATAADNLFAPLSVEWTSDFNRGQGGELRRRNEGKSPPKLCALHSSSVLVANVFGHLRTRNLSILAKALNSPKELCRMEAEAQFPTGYGFPANLDVALWSPNDKYVLAIESKYCEPFGQRKKQSLKLAYVPLDGDSAWKNRGLYKCDQLARDVQTNPNRVEYLDVPQLLKHILALHKKMGDEFRLLYLYYDVDGPAGEKHRLEAEQFKGEVSGEVDFDSITYQTLVRRLKTSLTDDADGPYFAYLEKRYLLR